MTPPLVLALLTPLVAPVAQVAPIAPAVAPSMDVFVDPGARGSDKTGDGSLDKPFQTIRKALALQTKLEGRRTTVHLAVGSYGAASGEALPVVVPDGVTLAGAGSSVCEIVATEEKPVVVLPRTGTAALSSVRLRDGAVGIEASDVADLAGVSVSLLDVAIENCKVGVDLTPVDGKVRFTADGLRVDHAREAALRCDGRDQLTLRLSRCEFVDGPEGVVLGTDGCGPDGATQEVTVSDSRFDRLGSGIVRRGKDGRNLAKSPIVVERCRFERGRFGVDFESPTGSAPLVVRDCDFLELETTALALGGGAAAAPVAVERCDFRWNGTGVQLVDVGGPVELVDDRIEDSTGVGLSCASVAIGPVAVRARGCVVAGCGGSAVVAQCERRVGSSGNTEVALELDHCTVVDGRGAGVQRLGGTASCTVKLSRCLVAGNRVDLAGVDSKTASDSLVGGEPRFRDRALRDYRLAEESPARRDGEGVGASESTAAPTRARR